MIISKASMASSRQSARSRVATDGVLACPRCLNTLTRECKQADNDVFVALTAPHVVTSPMKSVSLPNADSEASSSASKRSSDGSYKHQPSSLNAAECASCGQVVGGVPHDSTELVLFDVIATSA